MIRYALALFALYSCAHSVPSGLAPNPTLVLNSLEGRPPRPAVAATARPPHFPTVGERRLPGAKLWLVEEPGSGHVTIRVNTRRGNDGAYHEENMRAMILTLAEMLEVRLPYEVATLLNAQIAGLEVVVRSADAVATLQAIGEVLDGPLDTAVARRFLGLAHYSLQPADLLRPHLFLVSSEPLAFQSADALRLCRDERFSSSDRLVTLVGDFDTAEIIAAGLEAFSTAHEMPRIDPGELSLIRPERVSVTHLADSLSVALTLAAPPPRHDHYDVFNLILSMAEEPLPMIQTEHTGVIPPRVSTALNNDRPGGVAVLAVDGAPNHAEQLIESLFRYFRRLITRPFAAGALDRARRLHWASIQADLDDDPTNVLTEAFVRHLIPSQLEARYRALETLTPETLLDATRHYFTPRRILIFVVGPRRFLAPLIVLRNGNGFRLRVDPPADQF